LSPQQPLLHVVAQQVRLRGYLAEESLWRVEPGSSGHFIASADPLRPALAVTLNEVDTTGAAYLDQAALASDHGGPIAVRRDEQQRAQPLQAQYGVQLAPQQALTAPTQPQLGIVILDGRRESILAAIWRRVAALGVRESGF